MQKSIRLKYAAAAELFEKLLAEASNLNRSPQEEADIQSQRRARAERVSERAKEFMRTDGTFQQARKADFAKLD